MIYFLFFLAISAIIIVLYETFSAFRSIFRFWQTPGPTRIVRRITAIATVLLLAGAYCAIERNSQRWEQAYRVPAPLEVASVEYQLEDNWELGLSPGGNGAGLAIYRLTEASVAWLRRLNGPFEEVLPDITLKWRRTPVRLNGDCTRPPDNPNYQDPPLPKNPPADRVIDMKNCVTLWWDFLRVDRAREAELIDRLNKPGSYYYYKEGRSVTLVDPDSGKVYFAYAK